MSIRKILCLYIYSNTSLGKSAAILLARRGHKVYASVHYEDQINSIKEIANSENLNIEVFKLDILQKEERELILNYNIDVFISNAAIGDSGSVADVNIERIKNVFETNVFSNLHMIQLALKNMILNKKEGRIIILSSLVRKNSYAFSFSILCI